MLTGSQIRMARAALGWKVTTLSDKAGVAWARLQHVERGDGPIEASKEISDKLKQVFEGAGIVFLPAEGDVGPGVRLNKVTQE